MIDHLKMGIIQGMIDPMWWSCFVRLTSWTGCCGATKRLAQNEGCVPRITCAMAEKRAKRKMWSAHS